MKPITLILTLLAVAFGAWPAQAQTVPQKLRELETVAPPTPAPGTTSWQVAQGRTTLYVSGIDSARVFFSTEPAGRIVIAKVRVGSSGTIYQHWVLAGPFGWIPITVPIMLAQYADNYLDSQVQTFDYVVENPLTGSRELETSHINLALGLIYRRDDLGAIAQGSR